jgi:hypothetical protein
MRSRPMWRPSTSRESVPDNAEEPSRERLEGSSAFSFFLPVPSASSRAARLRHIGCTPTTTPAIQEVAGLHSLPFSTEETEDVHS